ncbi:MAG TPA: GDSL-type esterase/lipase family protein [Candidatus Absconditabacterales bacterium]|nr:GDSL-type esterase/lipase family protein [Candidatus Absconditabacterales bacterium]
MAKILVFGDSIAWGAFDNEKGGWVERLKTSFLQDYNDQGIGVYNLAVSSNDTRGVLKFLESDINKIDAIEPEEYILLFSIGSNDPRYIDTPGNVFIPQDEFKRNLQKIIMTAKKYSKQIFFTGLMGVDDKLTQPWNENEFWQNKDIERYDEIIANVCKENQVHFIPLMHVINESDLSDGLHPNTEGHKKIHHHIKEYISKYI